VLALSATVASAQTETTLTFDDLREWAPVPDGYGGFDWRNVTVGEDLQSHDNAAWSITVFNLSGSFSSDDPFTLESAEVGRLVGTGNVSFTGYRGDDVAYSMDVTAGSRNSTYTQFGWTEINRVVVSSNGLAASIDNVTVSRGGNSYRAPEPATYAVALAGLGLVGWAARRKSAKCGSKT
jgi:hypothetical protein